MYIHFCFPTTATKGVVLNTEQHYIFIGMHAVFCIAHLVTAIEINCTVLFSYILNEDHFFQNWLLYMMVKMYH